MIAVILVASTISGIGSSMGPRQPERSMGFGAIIGLTGSKRIG